MKKLHLDEEHKKKLDNFWYYYKYHTMAAVFALFCIIIFVRDMMNKVDYDYSIAFVGDYAVADEDSLNLQKWFEEHAEDLNGDGEVHVQISDYHLSEDGDPQMVMASQTKFTVDIQEETSVLFFLSQKNYENFKDQGIFEEDAEALVDIKDCKGFKEAGNPVSVQDMSGTIRLIFEGSKMSKDEEKIKYYEANKKLWEEFIGE